MTRAASSLLVGLLAVTLAAPRSFAQTRPAPPRTGTLLITVADPSGAVLPGAKVAAVGLDDATKARPIDPVNASDKGVATFTGLTPGRYSVQAEFAGFEMGLLRDIRVRAGDNKHVVVLPLSRLETEVTVTRDRQAAGADRAGILGTALTREQIDSLSDDPDELARQLQEIAGPATIRVDSFEGSRLPPKSQIKAIHITRDAFAAENHFAGALFIDIITQPGMGPIRGGGNFRLRDGSMSGRNALTGAKTAESTQGYGMNFGGSLIRQKSSFSLSVNGTRSYDTPNVYVALPTGGTKSQPLPVTSPRNNVFVSGLFDYAITRDQTIRIGYTRFNFTNKNLGIGGWNELERAYSTEQNQHMLRIQEAGPLGRRFFINTRMQVFVADTDSRSATEAMTIQINDARTTGGAQVAGGRHERTFNLMSDVDYVRGMHSMRTGIQVQGGSYRSDDTSNYLGTYTFESIEAFNEGRPRSFTRRIGDPNIKYFNLQASAYLQDDIRVRKNLTLSPGIRYETQTHISDFDNIAPRFGVTWSPFKAGKTSLRASWGVFYEWLGANTYEQTLRVDGFRQREVNIVDPSYPDPGVAAAPPINRYLLGDEVRMARTRRLSAGIDQAITSKFRVNLTYANTRGGELLRGRNLNAPVLSVRPDPGFANIVEVLSDAESRQHSLNIGSSINFARRGSAGPAGMAMVMLDGPPPPPPPPGGGPAARSSTPLFDWRRLSVNLNYVYGRSRNNTDGPFSLSPGGELATEWGAANGDVHNRFNFFVNSQAIRNLNANLGFNMSTAPPYTIRTGFDDNGDLVFNDRPIGVARNTARAEGQWTLNANFNYMFQFGKRRVQLPPGIRIDGTGGQFSVSTVQQQGARYRLGLNVSIQNLTNHANYTGFSGVMTSPLFGTPTAILGTRKIDIGMNFNF
jgi:carboxypeptidase family protein/TonB-dependent receptor-like protein